MDKGTVQGRHVCDVQTDLAEWGVDNPFANLIQRLACWDDDEFVFDVARCPQGKVVGITLVLEEFADQMAYFDEWMVGARGDKVEWAGPIPIQEEAKENEE